VTSETGEECRDAGLRATPRVVEQTGRLQDQVSSWKGAGEAVPGAALFSPAQCHWQSTEQEMTRTGEVKASRALSVNRRYWRGGFTFMFRKIRCLILYFRLIRRGNWSSNRHTRSAKAAGSTARDAPARLRRRLRGEDRGRTADRRCSGASGGRWRSAALEAW